MRWVTLTHKHTHVAPLRVSPSYLVDEVEDALELGVLSPHMEDVVRECVELLRGDGLLRLIPREERHLEVREGGGRKGRKGRMRGREKEKNDGEEEKTYRLL